MRPVACTSCGATGCSNCIADWKWKDTRCPNGCEKFAYVKGSQFLMNALTQLKIKCENFENGCHAVIPYDEIETH